ncbi:mevalonate kinase family protein [Portibacter lacus]|uniref:Mevalonate kinase n=1 Tax=Portibacter lacus TaxID=1099794 RepID=A0AA37SRH9_9BACT|nr:hypothetical protein [Portibacter lacus]GLR18547.1 mevalonate kinase [Portibacter lacus]
MNIDFKSFPAKILLFGEYLVIKGGASLAIPIRNYSGRLVLKNSFQEDNVAPFIQYLGALPNIYLNQDLIEEIDLDRLLFNSNIPIGYGAGSSGALTAAVFDAFVEKYEGSLQEALASMEDFFHGSSSGLDPLISYSMTPSQEMNEDTLKHFFLLDTGISRKTAPLVEIFKNKTSEIDFAKLEMANDAAIQASTNYDFKSLKQSMGIISAFQFEHFKEMIPDAYKEIWKESLGDELIDIKLCGAGGGGFLLLFANEAQYAVDWALKNKVDIIPIELNKVEDAS